VKCGDTLTIALESGVRVLKIVATGTRRGPPAEARLLYEDLSPAPAAAAGDTPVGARDRGSGRPTKRDRRAVDSLRGTIGEDFPPGDD
jgi:ribosome-associated heat shock protein Hsp15